MSAPSLVYYNSFWQLKCLFTLFPKIEKEVTMIEVENIFLFLSSGIAEMVTIVISKLRYSVLSLFSG
jgi:hypothetical protein